MRRGTWSGAALVALMTVSSGAAPAASGAQSDVETVRRQAESSLLVAGTIDIRADGSVAGHALDNAAQLADSVVDAVASAINGWRFEPVKLTEGKDLARTNMSLRLVARPIGDDALALQISSARFGSPASNEFVTGKRLTPPVYPSEAAYSGVGGTVYLVLKVNRDGRVDDLIAEQVNLHVAAPADEMVEWREMLAEAALRAAKRWRFNTPSEGEEIDKPYWSARVPVDFYAPGRAVPKPQDWQAYVPGPTQPIPWDTGESSANSDALIAGGVYPLGNHGPKLLTPLQGG